MSGFSGRIYPLLRNRVQPNIPGFEHPEVSVADYLTVEMDIFETFSWSDANIGFITDTATAMDMPALKPAMATQSYALTVPGFRYDLKHEKAHRSSFYRG